MAAGGRRGLKRIVAVYGLVEQMRVGELRLAAGAVDEVEGALRFEAEAVGVAAARARGAVVGGDGVDGAVAKTTRESAVVRIARLEEMKEEREEALDAAVMTHRESRVRTEQMKSVVERAERAAAEEEARRAQGVADDRYAGRSGG